MGLVGVLAWPEGWSPPSKAAAVLLRDHPSLPSGTGERTSRCNTGQSTTRDRGGDMSGPRSQRDGGLEPPGQRHLLCLAPQVGLLPDAQLKSPSRGGGWPPGLLWGAADAPTPPVPRAPGLQSFPAQGVPPTASFLPRQDQRQDLTWTAFY